MTQQAHVGPHSTGSDDYGRRWRRRIPLPVAATSAGALLINGAGRLAGWSLLDTQGLGTVPGTTNVLDGFINSAGTLMTVPANTAWYGSIGIFASLKVNSTGGAAASGGVSVSAAAGLTPNGLLASVDLSVPATGATATNGNTETGNAQWGPGWIINNTGGGLALTVADNVTTADVWAAGVTQPFPGGIAGTVVELYDGSSSGGRLLSVVEFPAGTSVVEALGDDGPDFDTALFLNVVSGTVRGSVWVLG